MGVYNRYRKPALDVSLGLGGARVRYISIKPGRTCRGAPAGHAGARGETSQKIVRAGTDLLMLMLCPERRKRGMANGGGIFFAL
jgi:hypothetical protein